MYRSLLEPHPHPHREAYLAGRAAFLAHERGGLGETSVQRNSHVGCELASDFIAQPNPEFEVVEPGPGGEFLDSLNGRICFKAGLKDQSLGQQQVFRQREACGHRPVLIDEQIGLQVIAIGNQSLDPDRRKPTGHISPAKQLCFDTGADLKIVILLDEPSVQQLKIHIIVRFESRIPLPFALKPDSVVVAAVPTFDVPSVVATTLTPTCSRTVFEHVDQGKQTILLIVDGTRPVTLRG